MGVSIHYRGQAENIDKIKTLCDDLAAIADKMNWRCTQLDEDWFKRADANIGVAEQGSHITGYLPLKGIALTPHPQCELLRFFFDAKGILRDPVSMADTGHEPVKANDAWTSVKTQYAGPETHIWIIGLLKYLKKYYLPDLAVLDEGAYWETGNAELLKEKMDFISGKIATVKAELSRLSKGHIESYSADEIAIIIEKMLLDQFG
jgi:hypothetical protein